MFADWPDKYKFTGIELKFSLDLRLTERSTYSLLEWLGDIGGLFDALKLIAVPLVSPFAKFFLSLELLTRLFRIKPSKHSLVNATNKQSQSSQHTLESKSPENSQRIKQESILTSLCNR